MTEWTIMRVLRDRDAGIYLAGVVVSGFGTSALGLASGVWVKDLTGSNGLAALCLLAMWAPSLAGPLLGTLADRFSRKALLVATSLGLAAVLPLLFAVDGPGDLWLLFAVLFVYGATGVVQDAAESALVVAVVGPDLLGDFNGLRMTVTEGMKLVAPLTGAGLYAAYGGPGVALLDAVTFVLAAGVCALLRVREDRPAPHTAHRRVRTLEGVRDLWARPGPRPLVAAGGATMLFTGLTGTLVYAVVDGLGHAPAYAGVLYAVQGVGSVAVGLVSGPGLRLLGERRFAAGGIALLALAVAGRGIPSDAVVLVCGAASGLGLPCVLIAALTAVQRETPGPLLGRATATANTLLFGPNVLGLALGAALVGLVDYRLLSVLFGAGLLVTAALLVHPRVSASRKAAASSSNANPA